MNARAKKPLHIAKSLEELNNMLNIDDDSKKAKTRM